MTFRTVYQLCIQVQESALRFNMHFFVKENSAPKFNDLVKAIQHCIKDLSMKEYQINAIRFNKEQDPELSMILCDDQSLQDALKTLDNNDNLLHIRLSLKSRHISEQSNSSEQSYHHQQQQQHPFRLTAILDNHVPVVKPTVYRWKPNSNNTEEQESALYNRRQSQQQQQQTLPSIGKRGSIDTTTNNVRKDSGISLETNEPVKKKKRVLSAEESMESRKLPELVQQHPLPPLSNHDDYFYNTACRSDNSNNNDKSRPPTLLEPRSPRIHPLDRRPSTPSSTPSLTANTVGNNNNNGSVFMPPISVPPSTTSSTSSTSSSSSRGSVGRVTLPAITSVTAPHHHRRATAAHLFDLTSNATRAVTVPSSSTTPLLMQHRHQGNNGPPILERHHPHRASAPMALQQQQQQQQQQQLFVCEKMVDNMGRMCGQTFRRSYDLSRHQTIHLKNRPYCYCDQCGKKFTRMDALRRHERVQGHFSSSSSLNTPSSRNNNNKYRTQRASSSPNITTTINKNNTTSAPLAPNSGSSNNNNHRLHRHHHAQQARV